MVKILFVCLGNICRSPAAEGVMKSLIRHHGLEDKVYCESAGTSAHVDSPADTRMQIHAKKRNLELVNLGQQFRYEHFEKFDFIVTMDHANFRNVKRLDPEGRFEKKVIPMSHFCEEKSVTEVPDPYYGGDEGFEEVLNIVQDGCRGILRRLGFIPDKTD